MRAARPALKIAAAAVTAAALLSAGACASGSTAAPEAGTSGSSSAAATSASGEPATLQVWMQGDTLKDIDITALNAEFEAAHPGVTVDLQEQTWSEYTTKVATGLADTSGTAPDVLELGNTQVAQFAGAGALMELDARPTSTTPTPGSGGSRNPRPTTASWSRVPVLRRCPGRDLPHRSGRRSRRQPAVQQPGRDAGGRRSSCWTRTATTARSPACTTRASTGTRACRSSGTPAATSPPRPPTAPGPAPWIRPEAKAGLQRLKDLVAATSRGGDGQNEADDALVMAQDQAAMFIDASWKPGVVTDPETGNPKLEGKVGDLRGARVQARHGAAAVPRRFGHRDQRQDPERRPGQGVHRTC